MATTPTTDGGAENSNHAEGDVLDAIASLSGALASAKHDAPEKRTAHLKTALGEAKHLAETAEGEIATEAADVHDCLRDAVAAPEKEVPYHINEALQYLEALDEHRPVESAETAGGDVLDEDQRRRIEARIGPADTFDTVAEFVEHAVDHALHDPIEGGGPVLAAADGGDTTATSDDRPPECVRWLDDDTGVLELEVTRPFTEWLQLEADESDRDGVEGWVRATLWSRLIGELHDDHSFTADVEADVPEEFAQRVALWAADRRISGEEIDEWRIDEFIMNHMSIDMTWLLDGEPWALTEDIDGDE